MNTFGNAIMKLKMGQPYELRREGTLLDIVLSSQKVKIRLFYINHQLYVTLVYADMKYASNVGDPCTATNIVKWEKTQSKSICVGRTLVLYRRQLCAVMRDWKR